MNKTILKFYLGIWPAVVSEINGRVTKVLAKGVLLTSVAAILLLSFHANSEDGRRDSTEQRLNEVKARLAEMQAEGNAGPANPRQAQQRLNEVKARLEEMQTKYEANPESRVQEEQLLIDLKVRLAEMQTENGANPK